MQRLCARPRSTKRGLPTELQATGLVRSILAAVFLCLSCQDAAAQAALSVPPAAAEAAVTAPTASAAVALAVPTAAPPKTAVGAAPAMPAKRPLHAAPLVDTKRLPLETKSRYIVDKYHYRVKWACVNWAGAYFTTHVVGGLDIQPLAGIARTISEIGFNCVRLPYSTQGWATNPVIDDKMVAANPALQGGKRFREVFKATVDALTSEGLMVIINNHNSKSGWCCTVDQDEGLWHVPEYNESMWMASLTGLAAMFKYNPLVVAFDVRNEPHDIRWTYLTWGDGNPDTDWAAAATRAGNAVLDVNPNLLIVVSGLCFCMDLGPIRKHPIKLQLPNRVVYEVHNYIEFQIATLVTNNFMSWRNVQRLCWPVFTLLVLIVAGCIKIWRGLGKPFPPKGAFRFTFSLWFSIICLTILAVLAVMYRFFRLYCNYYARTFLWMLMSWSIGCLILGIIGLACGLFSNRLAARRVAPEDNFSRDDLSSDDDGSEDNGFLSPSAKRKFQNEIRHVLNDDTGIGLPNWNSCPLMLELLSNPAKGRGRLAPVAWDRGLCCGLQFCCCSGFFAVVVLAFCTYAALADSYFYLQTQFDHKWAFALEAGHDYTAPVWLGEFGQASRGRYWKHLMSYMAVRDLDFAYWPLNGNKFTAGYFNSMGEWVDYPEAIWEDEPFGVLEKDYKTLRHPWKLLDLQSIMSSPAGWVPDSYPCDRKVLGNACGG